MKRTRTTPAASPLPAAPEADSTFGVETRAVPGGFVADVRLDGRTVTTEVFASPWFAYATGLEVIERAGEGA